MHAKLDCATSRCGLAYAQEHTESDLLKKLAELAQDKDQAFSQQMEQLCACGDQETLRDFMQGIFVER
jgi:hypothetical protein